MRCCPKQDFLSTTSLGFAGTASSDRRLQDRLLLKEHVGAAGAHVTFVTRECSSSEDNEGCGGVTQSRSGGHDGVCRGGHDFKCAVSGENWHGDSASGGSCGGDGNDGGCVAASTPAASVCHAPLLRGRCYVSLVAAVWLFSSTAVGRPTTY